jgi:hypothetical protein
MFFAIRRVVVMWETGAKVQIRTPVAAIDVRGATVWGGPIDNGYGVIVLSGKVTVVDEWLVAVSQWR